MTDQRTLLEDVERIEVLAGPGGTLRGTNAVNGVINIITCSAKDTNATYVEAGSGNEEQGFGGVRLVPDRISPTRVTWNLPPRATARPSTASLQRWCGDTEIAKPLAIAALLHALVLGS